jgi:hypothetical protein
MKITNGKIIILIGIVHTLFGISPIAFGKQFMGFASHYYFKISDGVLEFPLFNGHMNYENFAVFWFFYFGILMIPFGVLLDHVENNRLQIPKLFIWSYVSAVVLGVYMIPLSGMTIFMLPHAVYMVVNSIKEN